MNPAAETALALGAGLGALFFISLFALLARVALRRATGLKRLSARQVMASYAMGGLVAGAFAALGYADGGPIRWGLGFAVMIPPALLAIAAVYVATSEHHG